MRSGQPLKTIVDAGGGADVACRARGDQRVRIALLLGDRHLGWTLPSGLGASELRCTSHRRRGDGATPTENLATSPGGAPERMFAAPRGPSVTGALHWRAAWLVWVFPGSPSNRKAHRPALSHDALQRAFSPDRGDERS